MYTFNNYVMGNIINLNNNKLTYIYIINIIIYTNTMDIYDLYSY